MTRCMFSLEKTVAVFAEVSQGIGDADHTGHANDGASRSVIINCHGSPSALEQMLRKPMEPAGVLGRLF